MKAEWTPDSIICVMVLVMLFAFVCMGHDSDIVNVFILIVLGYFGLTVTRKYKVGSK